MRKFQRAEEPEFLASRWQEWGLQWEQRQAANSKASFYWHQLEGEPVNHKLLPILKAQTQDHCSFCDNFPVSPPSIDTIEHLHPKADFPRDAYRWGNLYFCCMYCQRKAGLFDQAVLRPDADDYEFDRYFRWDYTRGTMEVNEQATAEDQHRAAVTISYFRLNVEHPRERKVWQIRRAKLQDERLDSLPYRDFIGALS